ncbi:MAG: hypothetical protein ACE5KZ_09810 [Candidatus Scalinduaceae bacterium]
MKLIWQKNFCCYGCEKTVRGRIYSTTIKELTESEKEKALEHLKHKHKLDKHLFCSRCGKQILCHEIEDVIWIENEWKDLCKECTQVRG